MKYLSQKCCLLFCLFCFLSLQPTTANVSFRFPPPVEKIKKTFKKKQKKKRLFRKKQQFQKKDLPKSSKIQNGDWGFVLIFTSLMLGFLAGMFMFGFGIFTFPVWLIGAILMLVLNVVSFFASTLFGDWPFHSWFVLFLIVSKIAGGIAFLVIGLQISISVMWVVGIVMLGIALIGAIFAFIIFASFGGFRLW